MRARLDAAAARVRHPRAWLRGAWQGQSLRTKLVVMIAALMLGLVAVTALATAALFRVGGVARGGPTQSLWLNSGDVVVLAGAGRLVHHGIDRIRAGSSDLVPGGGRVNLTLRVAGSTGGA